MREIKFRAWNPMGNRFLEPTSCIECLRQQLQFNYGHKEPLGYNHLSDGMVFVQYTGLKDLDENEIYEGDILQVRTVKGLQYHTVELVDHMTYSGFRLYGKDRRWNIPLTRSRKVNGQFKVVGNIYQNPELLK